MRGEDFRRWAEHGCRFYGSDPWFLLRELAQNSRDAGARTIHVRARRDGDSEVLEFEDDGSGMSFEHARSYLFRLYASSKDGDDRSAGRYGIGFWTVLRFDPTQILVESRTGRSGWAIAVDGSFAIVRVPCRLAQRGTKVTLVRRAREKSAGEFSRAVRHGLEKYVRYLRRNDRRSSKLPVMFEGRNLTRSMRLAGTVSYSFREGPVEGAVGLADSPRVYLHARGLPVWKGTVLDELSHTASPRPESCEVAAGLAPVFLLNGNDLNVVMSRRAVVDDRALGRVRRLARKAMARLVRLHLDSTFPRSVGQRALDAAAEALGRARRVRPVTMLAVAAAVFVAVAAALWAAPLADRLGTGSRARLPGSYEGAVVSGPPALGPILELTYEPATEVWFKILTADSWDPGKGFVTGPDSGVAPAAALQCREGCIDVTVALDEGGRVFVPVPGGYAVDPSSVLFDGLPVASVLETSAGDTFVDLPSAGGVLTYGCGPAPPPLPLDDGEHARLTSTAGAKMPPGVTGVLSTATDRRVRTRVATALSLTATLVSYDRSEATAALYRDLASGNGWLPVVLGTARGDCDVLNGVNALLLRSMGVPARLAIGLVGQDGRAGGELHAWTEYHDGAWQAVDATPARSGPALALPPVHLAPGAPASLGTVPERIETYDALARGAPAPPIVAPFEATARSPKAPAGGVDSPWMVLCIALVAAGLIAAFVLALRVRGMERMDPAGDPRLAEHVIARIMTSASARPRMWRHARALGSRRVLPLIDGRRISLVRARQMARAGKLFAGTRSCELASDACSRGAVVLDSGHAAFGTFVSGIPGIVDLDAVQAMAPVTDETGQDGLGRLLLLAGELLRGAGHGDVPVLRAPGLRDLDIADVDLSALGLGPGSGWPRRFVAVNPASPMATRLARIEADSAFLAAFELVQALTRGSGLLAIHRDAIREAVSTRLVEEVAR